MKKFEDERTRLFHGDSLDVLKTLEDNSIDAVCTDPPSSINFMQMKWDSDKGGRDHWIAWLAEIMREVHRVLKPGGHGLVWSLPRTASWTGMALEDAGFEVRDNIINFISREDPLRKLYDSLDSEQAKLFHLAMDRHGGVSHSFGSGFPKSLSVGKAIDKMRDDSDEVRKVCLWLTEKRDEAKKTNKDIDNHFGFSGMASHWTTHPTQFTLPKIDQWIELKNLLSLPDDMDAEVWRLNGRKGTPGENWEKRDVQRHATRKGNVERRGEGEQGSTYGDAWGGFTTTSNPATEEAKQWDGWGSALKPAYELWHLVRKPLSKGNTIAANVLEHGTGAINVDGCRIGTTDDLSGGTFGGSFSGSRNEDGSLCKAIGSGTKGRFPANLLLTHHPDCELVGKKRVKGTTARAVVGDVKMGSTPFTGDNPHEGFSDPDGKETVDDYSCHETCPVKILGDQSGFSTSPVDGGIIRNTENGGWKKAKGMHTPGREHRVVRQGDQGTASRFFKNFDPEYDAPFYYCAKPSKRERNMGLEDQPETNVNDGRVTSIDNPYQRGDTQRKNIHPTVKSTKLMRYLCRLITPPGGTVLDCFMGSGSTGIGAIKEGFNFVGIEQSEEYLDIAQRRIQFHLDNPDALDGKKKTKTKKKSPKNKNKQTITKASVEVGDDQLSLFNVQEKK